MAFAAGVEQEEASNFDDLFNFDLLSGQELDLSLNGTLLTDEPARQHLEPQVPLLGAFHPNAQIDGDLQDRIWPEDARSASLVAEVEAAAHESDDSWTIEDNQEDWQDGFQNILSSFTHNWELASFLSEPLRSRQRHQIHAMAHLRRLSHVSLGSGKTKQVLIAKTAIHGRWNPGGTSVASGVIDPRIVTIRIMNWNPHAKIEKACTDFISRSGFVAPSDISLENVQVRKGDDNRWDKLLDLRAFFDDPQDAAAVIANLKNATLAPDCQLWKCEYTIFEACTWDAAGPATDLASVPSVRLSAPVPAWPYKKRLSHRISSTYDGSPRRSGLASSGYTSGESSDNSSIGSSNSLSASGLFLSDTNSQASGSKRTRQVDDESINDAGPSAPKKARLPAKKAGFPCSYDCEKAFDSAGDRTKHERIHQTYRPYHCRQCGHGFMYPKDLRRHGRRTGHVINSAEEGQGPQGGLRTKFMTIFQ